MSEVQATPAPESTQAEQAKPAAEAAPAAKQESMLAADTKQQTEQKTGDTAAEKKPDAPQEVKYELKLPEGSPLGAEKVAEVVAFAKERGLSNEHAQAVLERESKAVATYAEAQKQQLVTRNQGEWLAALKSDKDVGGEKLSESGQLAYRGGVDLFGEKFMNVIREAHLNHHPDLFRGLAKYGKMISNDKFVHASAQPKAEKSVGELFYPDMYAKKE